MPYNTIKITYFNSYRSLIDVVYSLRDEVQELKQVRMDRSFCPFLCAYLSYFLIYLDEVIWLNQQDSKKIKRSLEEEQRARKDLERIVRKVLKNMNDPSWDETNLWDHEKASYRFGSILWEFWISNEFGTKFCL